MRTTFTKIVCDRCSTEKLYEHTPGREIPEAREEWANAWPPQIAAFGYLPSLHETRPDCVCQNCLTPEETKALTRQQLEITDDIPF
jgi:hypothetical protein